MKHFIKLAFALGLMVLTGCSSENGVAESGSSARVDDAEQGLATEAAASELALSGGYRATLVVENGEPREIVEGTTIGVGFEDGEFSASAGCDSFGGPFTLTDSGELVIDRISFTFEGCDGPFGTQEDFLVQVLRDRPTLELGTDTISLATSTVTIEMLDVRVANPDRPLIGTSWRLNWILRTDGAGQSSAWFEEVQPLVFGSESSLLIGDACGVYDVDVEVTVISAGGPGTDNANGELNFTSSPPPSGDCDDFRTTALLRQVFEGAAVYTIFGGTLEITGENGVTVFFLEESG